MRKLLLALAFAALALLPGTATRSDAASLCVGAGGTWHCGGKPYPGAGAAYQTPKNAYVGVGGVWKPFYSTIGVSAGNVSGSNSGGASSGSVTNAGSPSTTLSGSYVSAVGFLWQCTGAPCASINNTALQNPTWSTTISGVGCQSSGSANGMWQVTATDAIGTQATYNGVHVNLTWNNTTSCLGPFTVSTSGTHNTGSAFSNSYTWSGSANVTSFSGGPISGSMSYSWTYVSGLTGLTASGTNTATLGLSGTKTCPPATTCDTDTVWNVHVIDLVSGFTADSQATISYSYSNNNG